MTVQHLLQIYYLGTPLFFACDWLFGMNFRINGLDAYPAWKYGYYAACTAAGGLMTWKPQFSNICSLVECITNLLALILGIMLPYFHLLDQIGDGGAISNPMHIEQIVNFLISGSVLLITFYSHPWVKQSSRI